jgi:signal transduction histidine kinase/CheY-like chemotaxis protein
MWKIFGEHFPAVRKLLADPATVGMLSLVAIAGISLYVQYARDADGWADSARLSAERLQESFERRRDLAGELLDALAADARLGAALGAGDAEAADALCRAAFARRSGDDLVSLRVADAQGRVVAGVGRPGPRAEADENGGIPAGPAEDGRALVRLVKPVARNGVVVGHGEADLDPSDASPFFGQPGRDLIFVFPETMKREEPLERRPGKDGGELRLHTGGERVRSALGASDADLLHAVLQRRRSDPEGARAGRFTLFFRMTPYAAHFFPMTDGAGAVLGEIGILEKNAVMWRSYLLTIAMLGAGLAVAVFSRRAVMLCRRAVSVKLAAEDAQIAYMMAKITENEALFESVFRESETGFVLQNWISGEIVQANRVALAIFDVDAPSRIDLARMHPLDSDDALRTNWQTSDANSPLMSMTTRKGVAYCELGNFFLGDNGEIQCIAIRDVTRVVNLQNKNRLQIQYLQEVIDQLPGMVYIKDSDCRLSMYNAAFAHAFGEGRDMIGNVQFADWLGDAMDVMLAKEKDAFAAAGVGASTFEYSFPLRDGQEHTFLVTQKLISKSGESGEGSDLLCVCMDITERSQMEKQLLQLRIKAEEANQAKSRFLAHMSHEIRTPMNVILGMSHLALSAQPSERQRNYLSKISGAAKNLLGIINDILDFSKIEAGEMTIESIPFSLEDLCQELESGVQMLLLDKPVEFRLSLPTLGGKIVGDPLRLRQVLLNLVNNAVKFTKRGYVRLDCAMRQEDEHGCLLQFSVKDTGIGIPKEALDRLFTSFQQVDSSTTRKYGGTGLGLSISRQLVRLMGGERIFVSSVEGEGSTFTFTLPLGKTPLESGDDGSGDRLAGAGQDGLPDGAGKDGRTALPESARILVVEDNELNQEIIVELLKGYRLQAQTANNGQEAVQAVEARAFDLVLMDLQMPVMDGLDATRAIRALTLPRAKSVPIIALTANAMLDDRERCLAAGMNDFLSKPIELEQLDSKLRQWLNAAGSA